jgi:hypothetical protein
MRTGVGLSTDANRIPLLAWILFLKCLDDPIERLQKWKAEE